MTILKDAQDILPQNSGLEPSEGKNNPLPIKKKKGGMSAQRAKHGIIPTGRRTYRGDLCVCYKKCLPGTPGNQNILSLSSHSASQSWSLKMKTWQLTW